MENSVRVENKSKYTTNGLKYFLTNNGRSKNPEMECLNAYTDHKRIAFREAIKMGKLNLGTIVCSTWNNNSFLIDRLGEGHKGDNNQIISPHTNQPAFTTTYKLYER